MIENSCRILFLLSLQPVYTKVLYQARMAELVDALVSKTNGIIPVPVRFRLRVQKTL